jgi:hypothetical protein
MVYVIQTAFEQKDRDVTAVPSWSCCSKAVYKPVWHIPLLWVQWITPDDGQRNCPKHVAFHFQNKFEKLVHLAGFITRKFVKMYGHMNVKLVYIWPNITARQYCTPLVQDNITASSQFCPDRSSLYSTEQSRVSLHPSRRKSTEDFKTQNVTAGHNFIAPESERVLKPCCEKM